MSTTDLNGNDIITRFELQVADLTELSSQEELDLLNDKYQDVCMERPWTFLKKNVTGSLTLDSTTGLYYIATPSDFSMFYDNNMYTDNTISVENNASSRVIFIGVNHNPYQIVNYEDREQYRNKSQVCYHDINASKIYFPATPPDLTYYSMDYIKVPADLTIASSPLFPNRFRKMLWYFMATSNEILQLSSKANSYAVDNFNIASKTLLDMKYWDDSQYNN